MFGRMSRSYELVRQSWSVLKQDKEIMVFPVLSALCSLAVSATFIVPVVLYFMHNPGAVHASGHGRHASVDLNALWYLYMFLTYLCSYFITIFFNVGIMKCAAIRMDGGDPTVADGFKGAFANIGGIFMWALVSATVGMILRAIEERAGIIGKIVVAFAGIAWSLLTYFAVPVIIFENADAISAIKRSGVLFKKTWGEAVVGQAGMSLFFGLLMLIGFIPIAAAIILVTQGTLAIPAAILFGAIGVAYWIVLAVVSAALQGVFHVALYRYAATGQVSGGYSEDLIAGHWRPKTAARTW